jgi:hypothetical protein
MKSSSTAWWIWVLVVVGVLALVAVAGLLLLRGRRSGKQGPGGGDAPVSLPPAGPARAGQSSVGYGPPATAFGLTSGGSGAPGAVREATTTRVLTPLETEAPLQAFRKQRHCTQCAAALSPNAKFCGYCAHPTGS